MFYIYCITNNLNGKNYIGQRKCPENKLPETDRYMGSGLILLNAYKKYGKENFSKIILAIAETKENINVLEKVFIALYREMGKAEYNIADGGDGGNLGEEVNKKLRGENNHFYGRHHSEETKDKNRKCHLGKFPSESTRKRMSESQKGRKHGEEIKRKMSLAHKGKFHKPMSEETKRKIALSCKGKVAWNKGLKYDENLKQKMRGRVAWNKGKHLSEETKKKLSESHKGNKIWLGKTHSEETKNKISLANKGKMAWNKGKYGFVMLEETKKKLSESCKGIYWWNNGIIQVKSKICPEGFVRGKIKRIQMVEVL